MAVCKTWRMYPKGRVHIDKSTFAGMPMLRVLKIRDKIELVHPDSLKHNTVLEETDLRLNAGGLIANLHVQGQHRAK